MPERPLPLAGVRVIDFTNAVAGPTAAFILGDMGAEVIKVESPTARSPQAHGTPLRSPGLPDRPWNRMHHFNELNRSKLGIALDVAQPEGREAFLRLAAVSDLVVENFAPRVVGNLGIDYPDVAAVRPDLIYISMPAFGKSGPYRNRISYGPGIDAMSGLSHLTGYEDGPPMKPGNYYCDQNAGLLAALAALSALRHRDRTGEGQYIELAMIEGELQLLAGALLDVQMNGRVQTRAGNRDSSMAPHGVYPCRPPTGRGFAPPVSPGPPARRGEGGAGGPVYARRSIDASLSGSPLRRGAGEAAPSGTDANSVGSSRAMREPDDRSVGHTTSTPSSPPLVGEGLGEGADAWIAIAVGSDAEWRSLCSVVGRPELAYDPRFADVISRRRHQLEADAAIAEWTRERDHHEAMRLLQAAGVRAGAALAMRELYEDPHVRARRVLVPTTHPEMGPMPHTRAAFRLSVAPAAGPRRPAPCFGEHNAWALGDLLGLAPPAVASLQRNGVITETPGTVRRE